MNVESLDSVVHILSGLRGAYAQIIETPEARRAAAEIAGRMQPAGSAMKTAQPIMQAPVTAVPRARRSVRSSGSGGTGPCAEFRAGRPCCRPPARSLRQARQQLSFPLRPLLPAPVFAQSKPGAFFLPFAKNCDFNHSERGGFVLYMGTHPPPREEKEFYPYVLQSV